jgi:hypothetical protein
MEDRPLSKLWIQHFLAHPEYGNKRFKRHDGNYPPFHIDPELIDTVTFEEFAKIEEDRIPLFIGSQFGVAPGISRPEFFNREKIIAVLAKSLLSGSVAGLMIYRISASEKRFVPREDNKLIYFRNKE